MASKMCTRLSLLVFIAFCCLEAGAKYNENKTYDGNHSGEIKMVPKKSEAGDGPAIMFADDFKQTLEKYLFGMCPPTIKMGIGKGKNFTSACDLDAEQQDLAGSSDSEEDFPSFADTGPPLSQLKLQQASYQTCLQATQELTGVTVLQSEVTVLVRAAGFEREPPITEPGMWREVTAECRVDLIPFSINFYVFQGSKQFAPLLYRGLKVLPVKTAHEVELSKSVLAGLRKPSDAVEVLRSYAAAYRSRRSTLARLADKYANNLYMEPLKDGGYLLKCANLLELSWRLENKWSPISPFHHRLTFDLEYMDESYLKAITQAHKQLSDPTIDTDERTLLLAKIISTCLEAKGTNTDQNESMESDLESVKKHEKTVLNEDFDDNIEINKANTALNHENIEVTKVNNAEKAPEKVIKANAAEKEHENGIMAPPKTIPKKSKLKSKENKHDNRKSVKRSADFDDGNNKKAKIDEVVDKINEKGGSKQQAVNKNVASAKNKEESVVTSNKNEGIGDLVEKYSKNETGKEKSVASVNKDLKNGEKSKKDDEIKEKEVDNPKNVDINEKTDKNNKETNKKKIVATKRTAKSDLKHTDNAKKSKINDNVEETAKNSKDNPKNTKSDEKKTKIDKKVIKDTKTAENITNSEKNPKNGEKPTKNAENSNKTKVISKSVQNKEKTVKKATEIKENSNKNEKQINTEKATEKNTQKNIKETKTTENAKKEIKNKKSAENPKKVDKIKPVMAKKNNAQNKNIDTNINNTNNDGSNKIKQNKETLIQKSNKNSPRNQPINTTFDKSQPSKVTSVKNQMSKVTADKNQPPKAIIDKNQLSKATADNNQMSKVTADKNQPSKVTADKNQMSKVTVEKSAKMKNVAITKNKDRIAEKTNMVPKNNNIKRISIKSHKDIPRKSIIMKNMKASSEKENLAKISKIPQKKLTSVSESNLIRKNPLRISPRKPHPKLTSSSESNILGKISKPITLIPKLKK